MGNLADHIPCKPHHCKDKFDSKRYESTAMQEIQNLPSGTHYYTDGSKSNSRVAAAYIVNDNASYLRLNDDATITQAELVAIWSALEHAAANQNRAIIHTDSLTAIQILTKNKK